MHIRDGEKRVGTKWRAHLLHSSSFLIDEMMPDDDETGKRNEAWFVPALIDDGLSRRDAL